MGLKRSLGLFDIVLMNLVAIIGLRWIASAAASGPNAMVLWLLAMLLFFIPQGLTVAELSSRYPEEGGIYAWTKRAFGDFHGFVCGWCYWVNNLFYFPSLLIFVSANAAFLFAASHPEWHLDQSKVFVTTLTLSILWIVAILNFIGMQAGKWLQNIGGLANWVPAGLLILLGGVALFKYGSANAFTLKTVMPNLANTEKLSFFSEMCFAFAGLELVSVLAGEIKNPGKTITRSIVISGFFIVGVYMLGTLGVLVSIPQDQVTTVNGVLLPIQKVGNAFGLGILAVISAGFIAIAGCGGTMAWFSGASRMPYIVGVDRYLPKAFGNVHAKFNTPYVAILVQVLLATLFTLFATAGKGTGVDTAYNILVDMCLILYFIPYLYLFLTVIYLRFHDPVSPVSRK
ncbi:MAG: APC family permease, partial [bacterium]